MREVHQFENQEEAVRFDRGQIFPLLNRDLGDAQFV